MRHAFAAFATNEGGLAVCMLVIALICAIPFQVLSRGPSEPDLRNEKVSESLLFFPLNVIPVSWAPYVSLLAAAFFYALAWYKVH